MDWLRDLLQIGGIVLLVLGGWSITDSLARIAKAMEAQKPHPST